MEGANVIVINLRTWETTEAFEEQYKWATASTVPMVMSTGAMNGTENFFPVEETKTPRLFIINYFKDFENYFIYRRSAERDALAKDDQARRDKFKITRSSVYFAVARFPGTGSAFIEKGEIVDRDTYLKEFTKDEAPVIILKGLALSPDEWEKYNQWFDEWANSVYIPMLLKIPGVIEYTRCWLSYVTGGVPKPDRITSADFPQDLTLIYFANLKGYSNFQKSKELAVFNQGLQSAFPNLNYIWDDAFRLVRRWSK